MHADRGVGQHEERCAEGRQRRAAGTSGGGRNAERDFHGEKRKNDTHSSTTDPDARLFRKGAGQEAKLCHMGHLMIKNRNGLIVDARLTEANGTPRTHHGARHDQGECQARQHGGRRQEL